MLRKRARSHPKHQPDSMSESEVSSHNHKSTSVLKVPGLFVGFNMGSSDFDSVRSPTSTLDFRVFSSFGNPFRLTRASLNEGHLKPWGCAKVGLSIVDSLDNETNDSGKVIRSFHDSKNAIFGQQMSVRNPNIYSHRDFVESPKSLPANLSVNIQKGDSNVVFEIGAREDGPAPVLYDNFRARSLDSGRVSSQSMNFGNKVNNNPMPLESGNLSHFGRDIKLSEDYTCVRTHGPNPKVTHIFGDCILECCGDDQVLTKTRDVLDSYPPNDFLKFCYSCDKKLDGEDIYMYRGEKAFCSYSCRLHEIEMDEEIEKTVENDSTEISEKSSSGLFIAT